MSDAKALRERLAVLREMGVANYAVKGGEEHIQFFPPAAQVPMMSPKDRDDAERARLQRQEDFEKHVALAASGGIRSRTRPTSDTEGGGSVNPALNDEIRRERAKARRA